MSDHPERPVVAVMPPQNSGGSVTMGVAAPIGAVSRKDRQRAAKTTLHREGASSLVLTTELPGTVLLEERGSDGAWVTVDRRPTARGGLTRLELPRTPAEAGRAARTLRVVFAPKNADITAWVSEDMEL